VISSFFRVHWIDVSVSHVASITSAGFRTNEALH